MIDEKLKSLSFVYDLIGDNTAKNKLLKIIQHTHEAGTIIGNPIDSCAICSRDLRHEIHSRKEE